MDDTKETTWNHIAKEEFAYFSSSERAFINQISKLKEDYPNDVEVVHENADGSIYVKIPFEWLRIRPKSKRNITDEQKTALKERLEIGRQKRLDSLKVSAAVNLEG